MFQAIIIFAMLSCSLISSGVNGMQKSSEDSKPLSRADIDILNKKCYNTCADNWDRLPFADFLPAAIVRAHNTQSGWKALDIGSGTGRLDVWLAKQGYQVLCLDPSDVMVHRTRTLGFTSLQKTIQEFATTEKFDLVLAILSLIHVPKCEMPAQINKIARMLNSEGVFALAMIEGQGEGVGEASSGYPRYFAYYSRQEILDLLNPDFVLMEERQAGGSINYLVFLFRKR